MFFSPPVGILTVARGKKTSWRLMQESASNFSPTCLCLADSSAPTSPLSHSFSSSLPFSVYINEIRLLTLFLLLLDLFLKFEALQSWMSPRQQKQLRLSGSDSDSDSTPASRFQSSSSSSCGRDSLAVLLEHFRAFTFPSLSWCCYSGPAPFPRLGGR